jgi:signal transduction histidine kinase
MAARIGVIGRITEMRPVSESIVRALERIHRDKELSFSIDCPPGARFQGERQDLEEMLGNLLDNASKWARSEVALSVRPLHTDAGNWLEIRVDDDGPGLTPEQMAESVIRGRRLDETKPGSGLGLSIVVELASLYGGGLTLGTAPIGGLHAELVLPGA